MTHHPCVVQATTPQGVLENITMISQVVGMKHLISAYRSIVYGNPGVGRRSASPRQKGGYGAAQQ